MNDTWKTALETGKISGAYLLEGASAESVMAQVDAFLLRLYCEQGTGCGICPGCVKYTSRSHADLLVVDSAARSIKVDEVREIAPFVHRKSFEGGWKAVVVPQAEKMTEQAQNALLKVLEEPPPDTVFLLGTADSKYLLPTILSRCILLRARLSGEDALARLAEEDALPTVKARALLAVARGDYYLAKKYAEQDYFTLRAEMVLLLSRLFEARKLATSVMEKQVLQLGEGIESAFAVALLYLQDVLAYKYTGDAAAVANADLLTDVAKHAQQPDSVLVNTMDIIAGFLRECEMCPGLNKKLILTGVLLDILGVRLPVRPQ